MTESCKLGSSESPLKCKIWIKDLLSHSRLMGMRPCNVWAYGYAPVSENHFADKKYIMEQNERK